MIQDIAPKHFYNEFTKGKNVTPGDADIVFYFSEDLKKKQIFGRAEGGTIRFPRVADIPSPARPRLVYLFSIDEQHFFLCIDDIKMFLEAFQFSALPLSYLRELKPQDLAFAGSIAWQLNVWYQSNRFCGRCGEFTRYSETERALVCPRCGNIIYPRINPAVIIGVIRGGSILVSRYAGRSYKGIALLAGFCEIGETAEQTVQREVMEEVGIHVKNIRYYKSQPWGFESDLLLGFYCEADGDEDLTVDHSELAKARFVRRDELEEGNGLTLTSEMIERFRKGEV